MMTATYRGCINYEIATHTHTRPTDTGLRAVCMYAVTAMAAAASFIVLCVRIAYLWIYDFEISFSAKLCLCVRACVCVCVDTVAHCSGHYSFCINAAWLSWHGVEVVCNVVGTRAQEVNFGMQIGRGETGREGGAWNL